MKDRLYTLLFAVLPKRLQSRLWNHLANKHGYHGLTRFGDGTVHVAGTRRTQDNFYAELSKTLREAKETHK